MDGVRGRNNSHIARHAQLKLMVRQLSIATIHVPRDVRLGLTRQRREKRFDIDRYVDI